MTRWLAIAMAVIGLAISPSLSQGKEKDQGVGGRAEEHRSEDARENSNAQWSEGATRGQERAAERRSEKGGKKEKDRGPGAGPDDAVVKGKKILEN